LVGARTGCGFIAGTLVHTREGLQPIEALSVGDAVLSRVEPGGRLVDARVLGTFRSTSDGVLVNRYALASLFKSSLQTRYHVLSTPDQPFWLNDVGWTAAERLRFGGSEEPQLSLADGGSCWFWTSVFAYATDGPAWYVPDHPDIAQGGDLLDPRTQAILRTSPYRWEDWADEDERPILASCEVFSLEVEAQHGFFVGEHGVWVRGVRTA